MPANEPDEVPRRFNDLRIRSPADTAKFRRGVRFSDGTRDGVYTETANCITICGQRVGLSVRHRPIKAPLSQRLSVADAGLGWSVKNADRCKDG